MKRVQKDRPLPLKAPLSEGVFRRRDSRFWQAKYRRADGRLFRRSTGTVFRAAALQWLACAKHACDQRGGIQPPPQRNSAALDAGVPELFPA